MSKELENQGQKTGIGEAISKSEVNRDTNHLPRRDFLKLLLLFGGTVLTGCGNLVSGEVGPEEKENLPPNVVVVETDKAKFRIIYGIHNTPNSPEDLGKANALVLESSSLHYETPASAEESLNKVKTGVRQFGELIGRAERNKIPIYFVDTIGAETILFLQAFLSGDEIFVGSTILNSLFKEVVLKRTNREKVMRDKTMSRRQFLTYSLKVLAGVYFFSQVPEAISNALYLIAGEKGVEKGVNEKSVTRRSARFLTDFNERIHPETYAIVLTLRNNLIAQKMITISRRLSANGVERPEIAIVVGASHIGIEQALQKSNKERMEFIGKLLQIPGLTETRKHIATIARLDFDGKEWQVTKIFKDPVLAPLEKWKLCIIG